jgi:hypothetical protein
MDTLTADDLRLESEAAMEKLRRRAAKLVVAPAAMEEALRVVQSAGFKDAKDCDRLRKEWFNDVMADETDDDYTQAARNPNRHFLDWLRKRVQQPFHVSYRQINKVARTFGTEVSLVMASRWRQEIAWAHRLRLDTNDQIAVLAGIFLRDAKRDPGKLFVAMAESYVTAVAEDPFYANHPNHNLNEDEIREASVNGGFNPLFLRVAQKLYYTILDKMSSVEREAVARKARQEEVTELKRLKVRRMVGYLHRFPLRHRCSVLFSVRSKLSSNDMVLAERAFLDGLLDGSIPFDQTDEHRLPSLFTQWLATAAFPADLQSDQEIEDRRDAVLSLGMAWVEKLPLDLKNIGGTKRSLFNQWRAAILAGKRLPPADPLVDYAMYLLVHGGE